MDVLYGLHPVEEAVRSGAGRLERVILARERGDSRLERLARLCRDSDVRVSLEPRDQLTRMARTDAHQGALALVRERSFLALEDLLAAGPQPDAQHRFFLALDSVEDPHNLGALLRTADGAGVDGVLLPERRSAPVSATVAKVSAGASEHVRIARVTNLVRSLEQMKKANIWVLGLDERGTPDYTDFDFRTDCVLVLGREGAGLHDLVKRTCDHLLRIPMAGKVSSLNVSVAGAVVMYEAMRQRRHQPAPRSGGSIKAPKGLGS
jgi:23S rRNA (guanosine2251-2'-O)-methyltransferase